MRRMQAIIAGLLLSGVAVARRGVRDQGRQGQSSLHGHARTACPPRSSTCSSGTTDPAEVQTRYDEQMKKYAADAQAAKAPPQAAETAKARD